MRRLILLICAALLLYQVAYPTGNIKRLNVNRFVSIIQIASSWTYPDTTNSGDDASHAIAISDTSLNSGENTFIFCWGDGDGTDDYVLLLHNVIFSRVPSSLSFWVKFSESDSCGVDIMLRRRVSASSTIVYADTTLQNPTGFSDNTWTKVTMFLGESGHPAIPKNTILDLIVKIQLETDETVALTNILVE